jgi:transporter family-2 protein
MAGGIAVVVQGQLMGLMTQSIGPLESVFITYWVGALVSGLAMALAQGGNLAAWSTVPWYALLSGVAGLVIIGTIGYVVPRLGVAGGFTVIVATQFTVGVFIDHFGLMGAMVRPIDPPRLVGLGLLLAGVILLVRQG